MFHVVEFKGKKEVEVIPSNWIINQEKCLWPDSAAAWKISSMICQRAEPNDGFRSYDMRSLGVFWTYEEARSKLNLAEYSSDIVSDADGSRKRKTQCVDCCSSSDSDADSQSLLSNAPSSKKVKKVKSQAKNNLQIEDSFNTDFLLSRSSAALPSAPPIMPPPTPTHTSSSPPPLNIDTYLSPLNNFTPTYHASTSAMPITQNCPCHKLQLNLLKKIEKEQAEQKKILLQLLKQNTINNSPQSLPEDFPLNLPLTEISHLTIVNTFLQNDENFSKTVSYLGSIGGNGEKQIMQRLLSSILHQELAVKLNWKGRGQKHSFQQYERIVGCIFGAAQTTAQNYTLNEAEVFIKSWLRFAPDRNGSKRKSISFI